MRVATHTFIAFTVVAVAALTAGCSLTQRAQTPRASDRSVEATPIAELASVEVRSYRGKRLDSITDFRENSIKGPQQVDMATYRLRLEGQVASPQALTYSEVLELPRYEKNVRLRCVEGWSADVVWEGVRLEDLLAQAGYDPKAKVVIFRAEDGYSSALPLKYVLDRDILLAYKMNGVSLPVERGYPFQVVAEDKWGYKWVKWVTSIEVSADENFQGYWEQRGYDNDATLPSKK